MASSSSLSSSIEAFDLVSPLFLNTTIIHDLRGLGPRVTDIISQAITYIQDCCSSGTFKHSVSTNCPWLSDPQVEEIKTIYFVLKNKLRPTNALKLKKGGLIDGRKRASFSYLIRENDFIVYTGRCIGRGGSKVVDEVIVVRNDGTLDKACHVKLHKEKRNKKYLKLIEAELTCRRIFDSPSILKAGEIYGYTSKSGVKKISWITPFYNCNAANVIEKKKGIGMRFLASEKAMPKNVVKLAIEMTQGLKIMHEKGWFHRDVKLENYLVLFDEEHSVIEQVALADTAFSIPFDQAEHLRAELMKEIKQEFFGDRLEREAELMARNPLFASLSSETDYPSLETYQARHLESRIKDPQYDLFCRLLERVDNRMIVGTPKHIAPELFSTRHYTTKVDLYALGFSFKRIKEQMEADVLFEKEVDDLFETLIARLTQTNPVLRPEASEVLDSLKHIQERLV